MPCWPSLPWNFLGFSGAKGSSSRGLNAATHLQHYKEGSRCMVTHSACTQRPHTSNVLVSMSRAWNKVCPTLSIHGQLWYQAIGKAKLCLAHHVSNARPGSRGAVGLETRIGSSSHGRGAAVCGACVTAYCHQQRRAALHPVLPQAARVDELHATIVDTLRQQQLP